MKKKLTTLIVGIIITFFFAITTPFVVAQNSPSPQTTPSANQPASAPVELDHKTLFVIQSNLGGFSAKERAKRVINGLRDFADNQALSLDEVAVYTADKDGIPLTVISANNIPLITISNTDAQLADKSRPELAQEYLQKIKEAIRGYRQERSLKYLLRATLWSIFATVTLIVALWITNNLFARIYQRLKVWEESYIHPVRFGNWELIRANQLDNIILWFTRLAEAVIILGLLIAYFPFVFRQFPWTRGLAKTFEVYLVETLHSGWQAFVSYLPSLLMIILVVVITYFIVRLSKPFFRELGEGTFSLPGFYPEWADATQKLVV